MIALLSFGFLIGVRHALEADHVAAVAALASRSASFGDTVKVATAWGVGHAASLVLVGGVLVLLGVPLPDGAARGLEMLAGGVLVLLGVDVLRRLRRRRIHFHVHAHDDGARHLHAHAHGGAIAHDHAEHHHEQVRGLLQRALATGGVHGVAGSGALVLLSMQMLDSGVRAFAYVLTFALGSILGMVLFSLVLTLPLAWSPRLLQASASKAEAVLGVVTIGLGCWMAAQAAAF